MKRKITAVLLSLILLAGLPFRVGAEEEESQPKEVISLSTPEDLLALAQSCALDTWSVDKQVVLQADISLEGIPFSPIATFGGIFDGGGHAITGLDITESITPAGLFGTLQSTAQVKNLSVSGTVAPGGDGGDVGGIAGKNYGQLDNCSFHGDVTGERNTGGIAGSNYGTLNGCSAEGSITGSNRTGGIAGYNDGKIVSCRNAMSVNTVSVDPKLDVTQIDLNFTLDFSKLADIDVSDAATDTGGIAGYSSGSIVTCANTGTVGYPHIGYNLGGIAGRNCGFMENCENSGALMGRKDVGGIVGQIEPHVQTLLSPDYLETLSKQFENLGGLVSKAGSHGSDSGDSIKGNIQALTGYQSNAQSAISALVSAAGSGRVDEGALSDLGDSIHGMASASGALERSIGAGVETLSDDISAISGQINSISRTFALATEDAKKETVTDISDVDLSLITEGRVLNCVNTGTIEADLNVGGITGTMGLESTADPEDDAPSGSLTQHRRYELKAIVDSCENAGIVTAKRSYAGGICGRMDLGLITQSRGFGEISSEDGDYVGGIAGLASGTVRDCFAKCTLSGNNYVGGIVGSGISQEYNGDSSTVSGCYSMVDIPEYKQFAGAISGVEGGIFTGNYFVSDTLAGINRVSYTAIAEPVSYEKMQQLQGLPQSLKELTLRFVADGQTVKSLTVHYGDSFDDSIFPEIPQKAGFYAKWDTRELTNLRFDTVVTADYLPYITALNTQDVRADNRPVFFVQGQFQEQDELTAQAGASEAFQREGLTVQEQWTLSIPADGLESHTIRYLPAQEKTQLYLLRNGSWLRIHPESLGTYLSFEAAGAQVELTAAVPDSAQRNGILLAAGALLLVVLLIGILLCRKAKRKHRDGQQPEAAPGKQKKRILAVLLVLILAAAIGAACYLYVPGEQAAQSVQVYDILKTYLDRDNRQVKLTVQAKVENRNADFTAQIAAAKVGSKEVSVIRQDERSLYYCDGIVYLENGDAFRLNSAAPDYGQLMPQILELCRSTQITPSDGVYTITVDGKQATELAKLLLPGVQELLPETNRLTVDLITQADTLSQIRFTGAGNLTDSVKTPFSVSAAVDILPDQKETVPNPVSLVILSGDAKPQEIYSDQLIALMEAWSRLRKTNPVGAEVALGADFGTLSADEEFRYYEWKMESTTVRAVEKDDKTVYFTDDAICNEEGRAVSSRLNLETDMTELTDILYRVFKDAQFQCRQTDNASTYTVNLSADAMMQLVQAVLPKTSDLSLSFERGSVQLTMEDGKFQSVQITCAGSTKLALITADARLTMDIRLDDPSSAKALPDGVRSALVK